MRKSAAGAIDRRLGTRAVFLIGFMGAGKSSVGRALGERLGWDFEDLDERIEMRQRLSVAEIFRDFGETGFRLAELTALKELLQELQGGAERIVALGGGAFPREHNARLIEAAGLPTVFLDAGIEELWRRCSEQRGAERPLLGNLEGFRELYEARRPHYLRASLRQETSGKTIEEIAAEVVQALGLEQKSGRDSDRIRGRRGEKQ